MNGAWTHDTRWATRDPLDLRIGELLKRKARSRRLLETTSKQVEFSLQLRDALELDLQFPILRAGHGFKIEYSVLQCVQRGGRRMSGDGRRVVGVRVTL